MAAGPNARSINTAALLSGVTPSESRFVINETVSSQWPVDEGRLRANLQLGADKQHEHTPHDEAEDGNRPNNSTNGPTALIVHESDLLECEPAEVPWPGTLEW